MKDLSRLIAEATEILTEQQSRSYQQKMPEILNLLLGPVEQFPYARGVADALYLVGVIDREVGLYHQSEVFNLLAWRMRGSLVQRSVEPMILINLAQACLYQKSFEEAYHYGKLAEKVHEKQDDDLLGILSVACVMTGRDSKGREYLNTLSKLSPPKFATAQAILSGDGGLKRTREIDCGPLLKKFYALEDSCRWKWWKVFYNPNPAVHIGDLIQELEKAPDGIDAWRCWQLLLRFYLAGVQLVPNREPRREFAVLQSTASAVAAVGKVIAMKKDHAKDTPSVWLQYAQGLGQLCFYELSKKYLDKSLRIMDDPKMIAAAKQNMSYVNNIIRFPATAIERPER